MESDSMKTTNREEIAEIVTHAAFYCGWPKAWAVFSIPYGKRSLGRRR